METTSYSIEELSKRICKLERDMDRTRRIGFMLLFLLGAVFLMGQAKIRNRTIEGERFILRDLAGNRRAELLMEAAGPGLVVYDPDGNRLGRFGATGPGQGASLSVQNPNGGGKATLISLPDGPHLIMFDSNGRFRGEMGANVRGPYLFLNDSNEQLRLALVVESEAPRLQMSDRAGFTAVVGSDTLVTGGESQRTHASSVMLFDKDRKVLWKAP